MKEIRIKPKKGRGDKCNMAFVISASGRKNISILKEMKVFVPYIRETITQHNLSHLICVLNNEKGELINDAFCWAASKEGHDFWEEKDELLRKKYYEYDENLPWS